MTAPTGFAAFHPAVQAWFRQAIGTPTRVQERGWAAIAAGRSALLAAPTGSGKTLAGFLAALDSLLRSATDSKANKAGPTDHPGQPSAAEPIEAIKPSKPTELPDVCHVLYISPLKALSNDIHRNLQQPLEGLRSQLATMGLPDVPIRAGLRTGDTSSYQRQKINTRPPHLLVTTPESFYLLLTSEAGRRTLSTVRTVIVDEIHALAGNRRGSHLALSLERLEALVAAHGGPRLQRIGLSATQKPLERIAAYLTGATNEHTAPVIINEGHKRRIDLKIEVPSAALEAVMAHDSWVDIYRRIAAWASQHRTTIVFVNTRRLAERMGHHLSELLGKDHVATHHGSLSMARRQQAEQRLKEGDLKVLVATASLELGIDVGHVDGVCQVGTTKTIAALLQRIGRSGHHLGAVPKGLLFPLTRDELVEAVALVHAVHSGHLDALTVPTAPLDVLAQQIVAEVACQDWSQQALYQRLRQAYPYRDLSHADFEAVVAMLGQGFSTARGRRSAYLHVDAVHGQLRARRGSRIAALTSGGAIPEMADVEVRLDPSGTFIGTVNEDFAIESMAGDIFQLGNRSWRILKLVNGVMRVADADGLPPNIPFWLGEAPARSAELSQAVSDLRAQLLQALQSGANETQLTTLLQTHYGVGPAAAQQVAAYVAGGFHALGTLPTQEQVIAERFFDEAGGMQLVLHSPFGSRINRAWGLALRKRFCRSFNVELQAAANEDTIVLSLGEQHAFPLEDVFRFLNPGTVRDVLVQAMLDAPMFQTRWRWVTNRALAVLRRRGGKKNPAPLQRMQAEDLLAAVFPDQVACLENIQGNRNIPEHPLVRQTIADCLHEAMDIDGLETLLQALQNGTVSWVARDLSEPSPLSHEILNARPYAFLDNAPLEERRTQAVLTRRALPESATDLGKLDPHAIAVVQQQAWPRVRSADEAHDALLTMGILVGRLPADHSGPAVADPGWPMLGHGYGRRSRSHGGRIVPTPLCRTANTRRLATPPGDPSSTRPRHFRAARRQCFIRRMGGNGDVPNRNSRLRHPRATPKRVLCSASSSASRASGLSRGRS